MFLCVYERGFEPNGILLPEKNNYELISFPPTLKKRRGKTSYFKKSLSYKERDLG
jgi:hypothetical protein